ncbi:MAG: hypothetical protein AB7H77_08835 [Bdellovibrionales bacterium]
MNDRVLYLGSMGLGAVALLLLVINVCLINGNRNLQGELAQRQNAINNSGNLNQLNQALVQALAQASINDNDKAARELLASQGITVKPKGANGEASEGNEKKK